MELTPLVKAVLNDHEDRRHTFSVTCYCSKKQLVLQASSAKERDEWVAFIIHLETSINSRLIFV